MNPLFKFLLRYRSYWPLFLLALLTALPVLFPQWQAPWRYDRSAVLNGEYWRLLSANLVHTNLYHWLLNLAGLAMLVGLFDRPLPAGSWLAAIAICGLGSTLGLLLYPDILWYVGLSGALHGFFCFAALLHFRQGQGFGLAVFALLAIKVVSEQIFGSELGTAELIGAAVITQAHLWGGISGTLLGLVLPKKLQATTSPAD